MKKVLFFLTAILAFSSCEGPMGPQGPQGEPGMPGQGVNWKVYDFTVPSDAWELVGQQDALNSYYMYVFEGDQAPKELAQVLQYDGDVTGYFVGKLSNGDDVLSPLPYIIYSGEMSGTTESLWSEQYTFDFTKNSIAFYAYYNDFMTGTLPPACKFRMSLKW